MIDLGRGLIFPSSRYGIPFDDPADDSRDEMDACQEHCPDPDGMCVACGEQGLYELQEGSDGQEEAEAGSAVR